MAIHMSHVVALDSHAQRVCPATPEHANTHFIYAPSGEALVFTCSKCTKSGCSSQTCARLRDMESLTGTEDLLASLKCSAPKIRMHVRCYHHEKIDRTLYYTDKHGIQRAQHSTYTRMAITHEATACIHFGAWADCSTRVGGLGAFPIVKLNLHKNYEFHDEQTRRSFIRQRPRFRRANDVDKYQSFEEELVIPGYTDSVLCQHQNHRAPTCLHLGWYEVSHATHTLGVGRRCHTPRIHLV